MAITPAQAAALSQEDYNMVGTLEKAIDTSLLQQFSLASRVLVVPIEVATKEKVALELIRRYHASNWQVDVRRNRAQVIDQITLTAPDEAFAFAGLVVEVRSNSKARNALEQVNTDIDKD